MPEKKTEPKTELKLCKVCYHPGQKLIDDDILNGVPVKEIAAKYALTQVEVREHRLKHVSLAPTELRSDKDLLLARMEDGYRRANDIAERLMQVEGMDNVVLAYMREAREALTLLTRHAHKGGGALTDDQKEWLDAKDLIMGIVKDYPEIVEKIQNALERAADGV